LHSVDRALKRRSLNEQLNALPMIGIGIYRVDYHQSVGMHRALKLCQLHINYSPVLLLLLLLRHARKLYQYSAGALHRLRWMVP